MNTLENGHDAEVLSIDMDRENSVCRLGLLSHAGERSSLELFGIVALRIEDFGLQNVVSRILRSTTRDFSSDDLNHWIQWATSLSDAPSWLKPEKNREWLEALNSDQLELIVFEPSAGAQIAAVCGRSVQRSS